MRGLKTLYVDAFVSEFLRDALASETVLIIEELKLRQNGINVAVRGAEAVHLAPTLTVYIEALPMPNGTLVYALRVDFSRLVQVNVGSSGPIVAVMASTWSDSIMATARANEVESIKAAINDLVDRFLNEYLKANPRN